jgi:aldehyde:ferredoxin oxidoreductase
LWLDSNCGGFFGPGLPALGDAENLLTIGERINNLTRLFNLREG